MFLKLHTIIFLLASFITNAQTTVQVGSGAQSGVPNTLYSPVYRFSASSSATNARSNILFTQDELSAAGITSGAVISSLQFKKLFDAFFLTPASFSIYMANSSNTSLSNTTTWSSIMASHTSVYTNVAFNVPASPGWVTWNITPFTYTGGSLEIATDLIMTGGSAGATGLISWEYTPSVPVDKIIGAAGTSAPATLNGTGGTGGAYLHRPNIKFTFSPGPLPVTLTEFKATQINGDVQLNWVTAAETNCSHFEIESASGGSPFKKVAGIAAQGSAAGSHRYTFTDKAVFNTNVASVQYRLKMVDVDGRFQYSRIILLKAANFIKSLTIFPNPFKEHVSVSVDMPPFKKAQIQLVDNTGKVISSETILSSGGNTTITFKQLARLPKGLYYIWISTGHIRQAIKLLH